MEVCGKKIRVDGTIIRLGFVEAEGYDFLEDPEAALRSIQESRTTVDIFTFIQKLTDPTIRSGYLTEWDNFAVLHVSTFEEWLSKQVDSKIRNMIRKAAKNGVSDITAFSVADSLVAAINHLWIGPLLGVGIPGAITFQSRQEHVAGRRAVP